MGKPKRIPEGAKWCPRCRTVKPLGAFYRARKTGAARSYCRACDSVVTLEWQHSAAGLAWRAGYLARPAVAARRKVADAARGPRPGKHDHRKTPRGKLLRDLSTARARLARTADPGRRARLEARLALLAAELDRVERGLECVRKRGPKPGAKYRPRRAS